MAEKRTIELEIQDNSKSLKSQYKEAVAELQKVSAQYGETSKQAINAAKAAAQLKDQIAFSKDLVSSFNPDAKFDAVTKSIGGALNGFQAYEGAMGLIGVQNEELQKTMLKVQSAMALSQGIQGVFEAKDAFVQLGAVLKSTAIGQAILTAATAAYNFVLGASTTGLKLFRIALISTGIGALVVGVGLLIANFDKLVGFVQKGVTWFTGLGSTMKNILSVIFPFIGAIRLVIAGLEALGVVDDEQAAIKKKNHENDMKRADAELKKQAEIRKTREKNFTNEQGNYDRAIKLAQAEGKSVTELQKAKINASIKYQETRKKELEQDLVAYKFAQKFLGELGGALIDTTDIEAKIAELGNNILDQKNELKIIDIEARKPAAGTGGGGGGVTPQQKTDIDVTRRVEDEKLRIKEESRQKELDALDIKYKRQKEDAEKELATDKDKVNKLAALNAQAVESRKVDEKTINDKYDKLEKDAAAKALEDKIKLQDEQWYALQKLKNSQQEQELLDLQVAYDKEYELAGTNAELQKALTDKFNKDSAAINNKYKLEKAAADKLTADAEIANAKAVQEQKQAIQNQGIEVALQGVQLIKNVFEKSKGVQKAAVIAESAIGIAKMIIANKLANAGALATPQAIATSGAAAAPVIALNNISTGIGIAANIAATAKALNSLGGGSAPNAPGTGGGGGAGGGGSITPQFNTVGNNGINQLAQLQQQPTMAYVVSGQVTSQQALDRNRAQNSSL